MASDKRYKSVVHWCSIFEYVAGVGSGFPTTTTCGGWSSMIPLEDW